MRARLLYLMPVMGLLTACGATTGAELDVTPVSKGELVEVEVRAVELPTYGLLERAKDLELARLAFEDADFEVAADQYGLILKRGEDNQTVRWHLADSFLALEMFDQAAPHYAALPAGHAARVAGETLIALREGKVEDTELAINAALELNPEDPRLWNALGHVYDDQARHLDAQDAYIMAMQMGGEPASGINNLGMSLMQQGRFAQAKDKFAQAAALDDHPRYEANVRLITALTESPENAILGMEDNAAAELLNDAGYIALSRGDRITARTLFTKAIEISPVYYPTAVANLEMAESGAF